MNLNLELFEDGEVERSRDRVHVTLRGDGRIYFSKRALEALSASTPLGDASAGTPVRCEAVALLYDKRLKVIGVMPSRLERKHSYRLRRGSGMGEGRVITARNFCTKYGINPTETVWFPTAFVNKDGILLLNLHETASAARRGK